MSRGAPPHSAMFIVPETSYSQTARAHFALVVDNVPNAMIVLDDYGHIFVANGRLEDLFGYGRLELLQQSIEILVPEVFRPGYPGLRFFLRPEEHRPRELAGRRKDGSDISLEITSHAVEFANRTWVLVAFLDISERKKTEMALRQTEDRLRLLLDSAVTEGIFAIDRGARCTFCNPAALHMLGYRSEDQVLGRNLHDLIHPTRPDNTPHSLEKCPALKALHDGQAIHLQDEVLWKNDGTSFHAECWSNSQLNGNEVVGAVIAFIDITPWQRARKALEKSEERFAKAFRESPMVLTLSSVTTSRFVDVNQTFERFTGYSREEAIGRTAFELGVWVDPGERTDLIQQVVAEGRVRDLERHFRMRDGRILTGSCSAELINIDDEQFILTAIVDITDSKRALQELQESEQKFRTMFCNAPAGMAMVSPAGRYLAVNKAFCDFLGYTEEELLSTDLVSVTHPEDRPATCNRLNNLKDQPDPERIEKRYLHKNGEVRWGDLSRSLIRDSEGRPAYMISQIVDITARKRMEAELRERERELKAAQRVARVGSWIQEMESDTLTWSDEMYRIHGLDPQQPLPSFSDLAQFFTGESWARLNASRKEAAETGAVSTIDLELIRRDGTRRWISARGEVERDTSGHIVRIRGTAQDITERKSAEQALQETEARFRTIANCAPAMIWMAGPDKLCTYFNQPWLDFTGRPLAAELGNGWTKNVHPEDRAQCMETYTRCFDRHEPFKLQYRLRRHDGEYRWIVDTGVPRTNPDGSFAGYIGSCIDDTDRRAGEEALRTVSGRLIEAQEKERRHIARELHDNVNQRLALLSIQLQRLHDTPHLSAAHLRGRLEELSKHTAKISSDIQALSHGLHSASLDYLGLVPAIKVFCDELAHNQNVDIDFVHTRVPGSIPQEVALGLFRVLQEGLQNAVKHSGVRKFEVRLQGRPGEIELTIRDAGAGFTLDASTQRHGLGLISMRERVHLLQGTLMITSRPRHGTELTARIPLHRAQKAS